MPTFETLTLEITDRIARITLNRPDAANAMNLALATDLARAALICDSDKTVKAVLITGNGKMFSAGGDLKSFATFGDQTRLKIKQVADELHKAVSTFARMTPVVIIAVNGTAAGAGFSLAMIGDIVIAAESAKFTMAYTAGGLSPDGSSTYYMPRLIGMRRTQELMLTNRVLSAREACDWGAVTSVVPDAELQASASALAQKFADGPLHANGVVKKLLLCTLGNSLEEQMELEGREIANTTTTEDAKEGIAAFLAKRKPAFK